MERKAAGRAKSARPALQMEGLEGLVLRGQEEFAPEGVFRGTTIQGFLGRNGCSIRIVVLLRNMRQDEVACVGVETFRVREELTDGMIGEMARA